MSAPASTGTSASRTGAGLGTAASELGAAAASTVGESPGRSSEHAHSHSAHSQALVTTASIVAQHTKRALLLDDEVGAVLAVDFADAEARMLRALQRHCTRSPGLPGQLALGQARGVAVPAMVVARGPCAWT